MSGFLSLWTKNLSRSCKCLYTWTEPWWAATSRHNSSLGYFIWDCLDRAGIYNSSITILRSTNNFTSALRCKWWRFYPTRETNRKATQLSFFQLMSRLTWKMHGGLQQMNKVHKTSTKHSKHCHMLLAGCSSKSKPSIRWYGAPATGRHLTSRWKEQPHGKKSL